MKKLQRQGKRFKGWSVGLDLHKRFIQYSVLDRRGNEVSNGRIEADRKSLLKLFEPWRAKGPVQVSFEACGCFLWVFDALVETLGRERVHVAQPAKVKAIAISQEKTDATDAWWLAYYLYEGRLPEAFVAEGALRELRIAVRELRAVTSALADLKRRFRSQVAQGGEVLRKNAFETQVGQAEIEALLARQSGMPGEALRRLWKRIQVLRTERDEWAALVDAQAKAFPEIGLLRSELAGVGPTLAPILWAELGSPRRFHSARAYAKATGLTPGFRESGGKRQQLGMTRLGSPHVRWALTRAIIGCLRSRRGPGLAVKTWVETRWKRKPKKVTIVAAARKMAEAVWRLFEWGEAFDLKRVYGAAAS